MDRRREEVITPGGQSPLQKKKQPNTETEKTRKNQNTFRSQNPGRERLTLGFSQPMLPAGQLDKRPKKHHIMPESYSRLSGQCLPGF